MYGYSYGTTGAGVGVAGIAVAGEGVSAIAGTGIAVHATAPNGTAGLFEGPVTITGNLVVNGQKSAAVPDANGELRRVFCMESPESYFEDFGRVTVRGGKAPVSLDKEFADIVHRNDYDVFLTPYGECKGLSVRARGPQGFEIHELQGGTSTLECGYRIVAKRRDTPITRLPKLDSRQNRRPRQAPPVRLPQVQDLPAPPELPKINLP